MTILKFNPKSFLIPMIVALPLFISCKDKETAEENIPTTVQEATLEQKKQALENVAPTSTSTSASMATGAINPAHGQPGHDCAVPVGAPLNGGGTSSQSKPIQTINANGNTSSPVKPISGSGAINPPHGQPGHRCDIQVGDPL
jgi:hypothetical protein